MHRMYMNTCAKLYFVMNYTDKRVDNVDQRMTMDLDLCLRYLFEYMYGGIFKSCLHPGLLRSITFLVVRWILFTKIMTWAYVDYKNHNHVGDYPYAALVGWTPAWVFATILIFFIPTILAARKFTNVQERQQEYEADLRYQHQLICNNAEYIGMSDGSGTESSILARKFQSVFCNTLLWLKRKIWLDLAELLAMPYGPEILSCFPAAICALSMYHNNEENQGKMGYPKDIVLQADLVRRFFIDACAVIGYLISSIHLVAQSSAFAKRVMKALELQEEFLMCEAKLDPDGIELLQQTGMDGGGCCGLELRRSQARVFGFQDVVRPTPSAGIKLVSGDIYTPVGDRLLLHDVNIELHPGDTCLLVGPSGTGKSSLVRVLARLWPLFKAEKKTGRDTVFTRPDSRSVFFIPQKPYMCMGSLRQQIAYPCWESSVLSELTDEVIKNLLYEVDLKSLYKRLKNEGAHPTFRRACTPAYLIPEMLGKKSQNFEDVQDESGNIMGQRRIARLGSTYGESEFGYEYPIHVDKSDVGPFDDPTILWDTVLSVGEQQRLQFARLIWHFDWLQRHRHPRSHVNSPRPTHSNYYPSPAPSPHAGHARNVFNPADMISPNPTPVNNTYRNNPRNYLIPPTPTSFLDEPHYDEDPLLSNRTGSKKRIKNIHFVAKLTF